MRNFPAVWGHVRPVPASREPCASYNTGLQCFFIIFLKPSMAFNIPFLDAQSFTKGYFRDIPNFRWANVTEKEE